MKKFSIRRFTLLVLAQSALLLLLIRTLLPRIWHRQIEAGWPAILATFLVIHLFMAFFEWFYHRYILHAMPIRLISTMASSHRQHHQLTRIQLDPKTAGQDRVVLNYYPITEEYQYEASAFPWWALLAFWAFFTPGLALIQLIAPRWPILLGGYAAITWSMLTYEVLHAIEHHPYEWWKQHIEHRRFGALWKRFYGFHHMHHANIRCNEAIGGFFGLPVADWVFRTYFQPEDLLLHGRVATAKQFTVPKPAPIVQWLDRVTRKLEADDARRAQGWRSGSGSDSARQGE